LSLTPTIPLPLSWYPPNFVQLQPAVVYLKKLSPDKKKITHAHVLKSLGDAGRRLTEDETMAKILEFQVEATTVIAWAVEEVKKRMLKAAARVDLKVGGRTVDTFDELKASWQMNGDKPNTARFYAICHGDYEGKKNQQWSRELELKYMRGQNLVYDTEPKLREKGGYEQCITHAKGTVVRGIMLKSNKTHKGKIVLSLKNNTDLADDVKNNTEKPERRQEGQFFFKRNVSRTWKGVRTMLQRMKRINTTFLNSPKHIGKGGIWKMRYKEPCGGLVCVALISSEKKGNQKGEGLCESDDNTGSNKDEGESENESAQSKSSDNRRVWLREDFT
jgi:hypothetical protein